MHSEASYPDILVCRSFFGLSSACCIQWLISRVLLHCYISTLGHTPSDFFILRVISGCGIWHCLISWVWLQFHFFKMGVGTCQLHIDSIIICGDASNISCQKVKRYVYSVHACSEVNRGTLYTVHTYIGCWLLQWACTTQ